MRSTPALLLGAAVGWALLLSLPGDAAASQDAERGRRLFVEMECVSCHGGYGEGDFGPPLAATPLTIEQVTVQLRSPRSRRMPTFDADKLSEEQIADLYAFLQSLEPPSLARKRTWWGTDLLNLPTPRTPHHRQLEVHFSPPTWPPGNSA